MVAFDVVFNSPPHPADPDDNLTARSALLLAMAKEFVRGTQRSVEVGRAAGHPPFGSLGAVLEGAPWGEVDWSLTEAGEEIESDLGIATFHDPEGNLTILLRVGDRTLGRPIPGALALDPATDLGTAAEEASRQAASLWGLLPDFVLTPRLLKKSEALREIGDCTVVVGSQALAVQVKHRTPRAAEDLQVEASESRSESERRRPRRPAPSGR